MRSWPQAEFPAARVIQSPPMATHSTSVSQVGAPPPIPSTPQRYLALDAYRGFIMFTP